MTSQLPPPGQQTVEGAERMIKDPRAMTVHIPPQQQQQKQQAEPPVVKILALLNQLSLAAYKTKNRQSLIFQMLNDTVQLTHYDRAVLWEYSPKMRLLGVSGQSQVNKSAGIAEQWKCLVRDLKNPREPQVLAEDSFNKEAKLWSEIADSKSQPKVQWIPIIANKETVLGLWLERWGGKTWTSGEVDILKFLTQAYAASWEKHLPKMNLWKITKRQTFFLTLAVFASLFLIRVPLRVVAPCEVVPKDPVLITAPLDGIVADMKVKPGEAVEKDQLLFEYDRRIPEQELKVAQKQTQITNSELNRATTLSFKDAQELSEVGVLRLKLQKEKLRLDLADYQWNRLNVLAPVAGIVMLDDPNKWEGKPVVVGERVLMISNSDKTQVRIWLPEGDNVQLDKDKPLKIILNVSPEKSYTAELSYIADYSEVNNQGLPSFLAEADWKQGEGQGIKMGLKGSAVLYGDNVSLFYWIVRRPWASTRNFLGF